MIVFDHINRQRHPSGWVVLSRLALSLLFIALLGASCKTTDMAEEAATDGESVAAEPKVGLPVAPNREERNAGEPLVPLRLAEDDNSKLDLPIRRNQQPKAIGLEQTGYSLAKELTKDLEDPEAMVEVSFNFDAASLVEVVEMFAVTLGTVTEDGVKPVPYFIDAGVSGSVTMALDTSMTYTEAWNLFEHLLWTAGAYASQNNGFIHIMPFAKMPKERRIFAKHDPIPNVEVALFRLHNVTAAEMKGLTTPFMTEGATSTPIAHINALLVVEAPSNMAKLTELINKLDVIGEAQWPQISFACRYVDAGVVVDELKQILPTIGFNVTGEKGDGRSIKMIALERLQVIIATAPTNEVLEEIQRWVDVLDREDAGEQERIYFYPVKFNKAEDLSEAISVFFNATASQTTSSRSSSSSSTTSGTTPTSTAGSGTRTSPRAASSRRSNRNNETPTTIFDVPVTILADGSHNRLVIRTTPRAYAMLQALLRRLDTPPLQVLVQVSIAEIQLNKDTQFGFQYAALNRINEYEFKSEFTPGTTSDTPLYNFTFNTAGVASAADLTNPGDVFSFIQAVAGRANTRVLFTPQIIAISDEEAVINVGDSVPIVTQENNNTSSNSNISRSIQYQDTGIILTVTPHITANKLVTLDINQSVSDAVETTSSDIDSPTIQTRSLETSLVVADGSTVLLGGLLSSRRENRARGLPIIKDIPWLGKFFSSESNLTRRQELLVMISVQVVDMDTDIELLTRRYQEAVNTINRGLAYEEKK